MVNEVRILHVDDEPDFIELVTTFLERKNEQFQVGTATSASDGLDQLAADEYDCIVSDYDMPGQDGIEFLEAVREDYPDLPFILYTGKGSEEVASDAITAGATDYLQKGSGTEQYELLANRITNAINQYRSSRRAVNLWRIRTIRSEINQALIRSKSRSNAEARVCEIISESEPYLFTWIGEMDSKTQRLEPRAWAGIGKDYLDDITVTADDTETGQGPGGTALQERRIAVSQNVQQDPDFEPWREDALERGYQSLAAVPLEYEDTFYGVLGVYAEQPNAFDEDERNLLAEIGDDIAHAFHSIEVQDQLRTERDQRRALFENAPGPMVAAEIRDGGDTHIVTAVNNAFEEVFNYDTEAVVGKDPSEFLVPEKDLNRHEEFRERANTGNTFVAEVDRITADGPRTFLLQMIPYGLDDSRADGLYACYTDISERSERERAITKLHQATNELMEATAPETVADIATEAVTEILDMPNNGVHLYDEEEEGLVPIAWTEQAEEIVGEPPIFTPGEGIAGRAFETGEPQIYRDISTAADCLNPDTDIRSEIIFPLADHGVLVIGSSEPDAFDETDVSLAKIVATHMTTALDAVEHERELKKEQAFIEQALDTLSDMFYVIGVDGNLRRWNHRASRVTGYPRDELAEMYATELFPEDEQETVANAIEETISTGEAIVEADILTADGERIPYEFTGDRLTGLEGDVIGLIGVGRDISDRKQREQELERQNERLNEFSNVVSHDLRNPLNVVEGRLELAREDCDSEHLDDAASAVDRSLTLIDDLLTLAREGETVSETESVGLSETVEGCWQNVETNNATLVTETDRTIRADSSRFQQLLENLIRNAVEHGGDDITITVGGLDDGFYIADNGPGIPEEKREQVFEAGYSTTNDGTGFGLNIAKEVAKAHGWDICVTEDETGGARFEITGIEFAV
ncbi:PAS domain S-box protein [Halorubrum sp. BOL3-1]|uniref:GAF domain-containing protein n=1 Tax=Halorubrum sp. BOL3-1 TaxID=2497325 RepID=UPI001004D948|nr:GAF domain-containing protein [Halorubrum sp. BOL3-1]QAU14158.1 PAS domain S-box protein [Halorubrum sp. BOL3-1]